MATSPLNVAVDGTGGRDGTPMGLTQAVREGRPIGKVGIGGVDIRAKDGRQMSGDALQLQVPRHHHLSLRDPHRHRHQCLIQHPLLQMPRPLRLLARQRAVDKFP